MQKSEMYHLPGAGGTEKKACLRPGVGQEKKGRAGRGKRCYEHRGRVLSQHLGAGPRKKKSKVIARSRCWTIVGKFRIGAKSYPKGLFVREKGKIHDRDEKTCLQHT